MDHRLISRAAPTTVWNAELDRVPPQAPFGRARRLNSAIGRPGTGWRSFVVGVLLVSACAPVRPVNRPLATPRETLTPPSASPSVRSTPTVFTLPIPAREAQLANPVGLLSDGTGDLYVAACSLTDSYIYRIDANGTLTTYAGAGPSAFTGDGGPATSANLQCPVTMAIGPEGALYFADHRSNRIRRVDITGTITTVAGSGPAGVDMGSFSGDGGPATSATLREPWGITFDNVGNLYIADRDNYRVRRVDLDGVITTVAGNGKSRFSGDRGPAIGAGMCPVGVAVDGANNLLIADSCNNRVRKVDRRGRITTIGGSGKSGSSGDRGPAISAALEAPRQFAFALDGAVFVASGLRIRELDAQGGISTRVGSGKVGVPVEGTTALKAPFPAISGVAVDRLGNIYIADGITSVYRIDTKGRVTLFAGKTSG
jgi:hypothetical protein